MYMQFHILYMRMSYYTFISNKQKSETLNEDIRKAQKIPITKKEYPIMNQSANEPPS